MADSMAHLGGVINKGSQFIAKIDTKESGTRFYILGPVRDEEQKAAQDLSSIRAAADGYLPRSSGMKAMQLAAKHLRDEAKAMPSGSIEKVDGRFIAMIDTNHSGPVQAAGHPRPLCHPCCRGWRGYAASQVTGDATSRQASSRRS